VPRSRLALLAILVAAAAPGVARAQRFEKETLDAALAARELEVDPEPQGKTLGQIHVFNLDVFTPSDGWLTWFNRFHITTREISVAREVLLRPGEAWNASVVDETRRRLRDPYLTSAVAVVPVKSKVPGQVDLLVATRDLWSLRMNSRFEVQDGALTMLTASLAENNFLGRRKKVAAVFLMDQGSVSVGPIYDDPNLGGTHLTLLAHASAVYDRDTLQPEGAYGYARLAYPLWSLRRRWSASIETNESDRIVRSFVGNDLRTYDDPDSPEVETLPYLYRLRRLSTDARVTRAFGSAVVNRISLGHQIELTRPSFAAGFPGAEGGGGGDEEDRAAFARDVFPRSELSSSLFAHWLLFTPRYAVYRDLDAFDLSEDKLLGPQIEGDLSVSSHAFGSEEDFIGLSLGARYTAALGSGLISGTGVWSGRFDDGELIDNRLTAQVSAASPQLAKKTLRVVAEATVDVLVNERSNRYFVLGGDNGLRGFPIGIFFGRARAVTHLELRTSSFRLLWWEVGGVTFWDAGDVADEPADWNLKHDVGVGLRVLFPQLNPLVMRGDWALPLNGPAAGFPGRFSIGFQQVF
jgi:hypothetical protein